MKEKKKIIRFDTSNEVKIPFSFKMEKSLVTKMNDTAKLLKKSRAEIVRMGIESMYIQYIQTKK